MDWKKIFQSFSVHFQSFSVHSRHEDCTKHTTLNTSDDYSIDVANDVGALRNTVVNKLVEQQVLVLYHQMALKRVAHMQVRVLHLAYHKTGIAQMCAWITLIRANSPTMSMSGCSGLRRT